MPDIDWFAALSQASQDAGTQLGSTPAAFSAWAGPAADRAAAATGIDRNTILGQWGLESGWGQHVIPGTNNLGNIKSSGGGTAPGVSATDNALGTKSNYQSFNSLNDFADHYANTINSYHSGAANTGANVDATASALSKSGYAQDPQYASKLVKAAQVAQMASGASGAQAPQQGQQDWGSQLSQALGAPPTSATPQCEGSLPFGSTDALLKQYPGVNPSADPTAPGSSNAVTSFGAGVGQGFGKAVLGAQSLVGQGLSAVGADSAGQWLQNDAQTGASNLDQQANAVGQNGTAQSVGNFAGAVAPALIAGPEVLPQAAMGALQASGGASLNGQAVLPAAVEGGALGAGGALAGKLIGSGIASAKPAVVGLIDKLKGGESAAARQIAGSATDVGSAASNLQANANEIIPGSLPTAAESANDAGITAYQRGIANSQAGQAALPVRQAANDQARLAAGNAAVGNLQADVDAFTNAQATRVAQGQTELSPVTQQQADTMQTPSYAQAIARATREAADNGVTDFADQQQGIQQGLANQIDQVAGTPQSLEAAVTARRAQARVDYGGLANDIDVRISGFGDLAERPGVMSALREAATGDANRLGTDAEPAFTQQPGTPRLVPQTDGSLGWVETPGPTTVNAQTLIKARSILADQANSQDIAGNANKANDLRGAMRALDEFNASNIPGFADANANHAANSVPVHQQTVLQTRLNGAVDPLTGTVNPICLSGAIRGIEGAQLKPGVRPEDRITPGQLGQLQDLGTQARQAPTNMTGLSPQGQELLRQQLAAQAERGNDVASEHFHRYLSGQSPSYNEFNLANQTQLPSLNSRAALQEGLDKIDTAANNAQGGTAATLDKAQKLAADDRLTGEQRDYAIALLQDLKRRSTMNAQTGAAGSQSAANLNSKHGLLAQLANTGLAEKTLMGAVMSGHILTAGISVAVKSAIEKASARTEKAAIGLLLDPKRLGAALEKLNNEPTASAAFMTALRQKAGVGTMAGAGLLHALQANANGQEQ